MCAAHLPRASPFAAMESAMDTTTTVESQIPAVGCQQTPSPSPSPLTLASSSYQRRTRPKQFGVGGGQVRIVGVHSEPGSFAIEESPLEEEKPLTAVQIEEVELTAAGRKSTVGIAQETSKSRHKNQRQQSAMSSLYRQATVSAAAASVFNSTATTVANALEFANVGEGQQPNVPPSSRPQSANSQNSFSSNTDSGSIHCGARPRRMNKAPTLQCTSSEEGSDSPMFSRTTSAQSLPAPPQSHSIYERTLQMLANDPQYQKEIALGKRVGFYRLGKELGSGNFSKVKLGIHVITKEKVAIKMMEKGKMDQKAQRLLAREIDNMELMHHPNIIRLFEVVSTLSKVYLVMEYAGGGELYTYVHDNGKLTEEVAKPIFAQIVSAVAHLHSKNICHRDIKAENVFLSHPGWVKIGDFGFSCKFQQDICLNTFCGSPPYAAPELFRDQHYVGPMVDIWALGILLYFMLVGVTPFRGETVSDLKRNILEGIYYMPEYVSTFAQHFITRMLELDAKRRANITELKRTYWLNECKFPDSYVNLSLNPDESSLDKSELERHVWGQLNSYGINEEMIRGAQGKGARNAIIGTYRITLYQCQARDRDEERAKLNEHLMQLAERDQLFAAKFNQRSKTCSLL